jgi:hypothetical protein
MTQPLDECALEAAARAVAIGMCKAYTDDAIWAEDVEWQRRRQHADAPFKIARAAVTAYLDTIQETLVPNIEKAYNVDFNNARNTMDVDALLEELNYLRFLVKLEKKATWEYSRV